MENKTRAVADERVTQESHAIMAKNFRVGVLLLLLLLLVKAVTILAGSPWHTLLPEAAGLLVGGVVCVAWMTIRRLWGRPDERIAAERAICLSTSWTAMHCVALLTATALLIMDDDRSLLYVLTMLAMMLIQYLTMGRMTRRGLYGSNSPDGVWKRLLPVLMAVLVIAPAMLWGMGLLRRQTYPVWAYVVVELILLGACLLGGLLAKRLTLRSATQAESQLRALEESDEE